MKTATTYFVELQRHCRWCGLLCALNINFDKSTSSWFVLSVGFSHRLQSVFYLDCGALRQLSFCRAEATLRKVSISSCTLAVSTTIAPAKFNRTKASEKKNINQKHEVDISGNLCCGGSLISSGAFLPFSGGGRKYLGDKTKDEDTSASKK